MYLTLPSLTFQERNHFGKNTRFSVHVSASYYALMHPFELLVAMKEV